MPQNEILEARRTILGYIYDFDEMSLNVLFGGGLVRQQLKSMTG